ncbi:MAG: hypothetical protein AMXMBFR34_00130 [Myxococcaceae bacterium]
MPDKLIFSQTFEGLFRATAAHLDEPTVAALKAAGIDPQAELKPSYPLPVFHAVVKLLAQRLFPEAGPEEQLRRLGRQFMDGYALTMVGRAMVGMMRVIGPQRTLDRLSRQFRTGNNFSETRVEELGPGQSELWCNQVTWPSWYEGIVARGLEFAGGKDVQVQLIRRDDDGATFRVTWRR